jgi:hypothetical protein
MSEESNEGTTGGAPDELAEMIARAQTAADNGDSPRKIRMQLVQEGMDPDAADAIVQRVCDDRPLSSRHRVPASSGGGNSWAVWIGILVLINGLSWLFDWPFWIY